MLTNFRPSPLIIATIFFLLKGCIFSENHDATKLFTPESISETMKKVCDWQLENLSDEAWINNEIKEELPNNGWIRGTLYTGVMATYYTTLDKKYLDNALSWGEKNNWEPGPRKRHADDQCVGQTYTELFFIQKDSAMLKSLLDNFNLMIEKPAWGPDSGWSKEKNWSWCDAIFMAPPAMVRAYHATNNRAYLDLMNKLFWDTYYHLYDKEDHLFFRDSGYILNHRGEGPRSTNGEKIFWGRGNGWVLAGLARTLEYLPENYPFYPDFISLFREMSNRIKDLQQEDGLWRSSLLDPENYPAPETSSSSLFTFALAWGINNGILDKKTFKPVVYKAWEGLNMAVSEEGKLGWVQPVGHDPKKVTADDTMEFGVGAFLLAAREVYLMVNEDQI